MACKCWVNFAIRSLGQFSRTNNALYPPTIVNTVPNRTLVSSTVLHQRASRVNSHDVVPTDKSIQHTLVNDIENRVNEQIANSAHGRLFAVIHINGHQFKVTNEDLVLIRANSYFPDVGQRIVLEKVLLAGSKDFTLVGQPLLSNVRVEATVVEKTLSYNKTWFAYRRRKNSRKLKVVQDFQTILRINNITLQRIQVAEEVD